MGRCNLLQPCQRLDAALRLARLGGLGAEAVDEAVQMGDLALLTVEHRLLRRQMLGAGALERRVVAGVELEAAALDVGDAAGDVVEEIAVVGNQQQRAAVILEPLFEPDDGIEVQVIGGLVEQQQVGAAHQRPPQVQPHAPAAGEARHRLQELPVGKTQAVQQGRCPGPGAVAVDVAQQLVAVGEALAVMGRLRLGDLGLDLAQFGVAVEHVLQGGCGNGRRLLRHVGDHPARRQFQIARVGVQLSPQHGEQAGLAAAVGADHAHLLSGVDLEGGAFDQRARAASEGEIAQLDHGSGKRRRKATILSSLRTALPGGTRRKGSGAGG